MSIKEWGGWRWEFFIEYPQRILFVGKPVSHWVSLIKSSEISAWQHWVVLTEKQQQTKTNINSLKRTDEKGEQKYWNKYFPMLKGCKHQITNPHRNPVCASIRKIQIFSPHWIISGKYLICNYKKTKESRTLSIILLSYVVSHEWVGGGAAGKRGKEQTMGIIFKCL